MRKIISLCIFVLGFAGIILLDLYSVKFSLFSAVSRNLSSVTLKNGTNYERINITNAINKVVASLGPNPDQVTKNFTEITASDGDSLWYLNTDLISQSSALAGNKGLQTAAVNGLKNLDIVRNKLEGEHLLIERPQYKVSTKDFIDYFASLLISANSKIIAGASFESLSKEENAVWILANPASGVDQASSESLKQATKILFDEYELRIIRSPEAVYSRKLYKLPEETYARLKKICEQASTAGRDYCFSNIAYLWGYDYDCSGDSDKYEQAICLIWRAHRLRDSGICEKLEGDKKMACQRPFGRDSLEEKQFMNSLENLLEGNSNFRNCGNLPTFYLRDLCFVEFAKKMRLPGLCYRSLNGIQPI